MSLNIGSTSSYVVPQQYPTKKDLEYVSRYANNAPLEKNGEELTVASALLIPAGLSGAFFALSNYIFGIPKAIKKIKERALDLKDLSPSSLIRYREANDLKKHLSGISDKFNNPKKLKYYNNPDFRPLVDIHDEISGILNDKVKRGNITGKDISEWTKRIDKANVFRRESMIKNGKGIKFLNNAFKKSSSFFAKTPLLSRIVKSQGGLMFGVAMFLIPEIIFTVVPTAKELGPVACLKQLAKSIPSTIVDILGFGSGMMAGAKIGAAATSILGPAGAVAGAAIGAVSSMSLGMVASHLTRKATNAVLGECELDKAKFDKAKAMEEVAANNPNELKKLLMLTSQRLSTEGVSSDEAKKVVNSMEKILASNPALQQEIKNDILLEAQKQEAALSALKTSADVLGLPVEVLASLQAVAAQNNLNEDQYTELIKAAQAEYQNLNNSQTIQTATTQQESPIQDAKSLINSPQLSAEENKALLAIENDKKFAESFAQRLKSI